FKMEVAACFISKSLEKLPSQSKTEGRGHILFFLLFCNSLVRKLVQSSPNKEGSATKIDHATGQTLIHWHISFPFPFLTTKSRAITPNSLFPAQCLQKSLPERNPAIFHSMMGINLQIPFAFKLEVRHRMLRKKRQHVI